jgi:chromosome segregation ATPase
LIEQAIFSCIGFLVAGLLALTAVPAVMGRARRLAEARARLQAPLTEAQAVAERDALRAQHAVEQFRLEQRLNKLAEIAARRQIEIGRLASRLAGAEDRSGEHGLEIAAQREELAALEREARELRGQLGAAQLALRDLSQQSEASAAAFAAAEARRVELTTLADENRTTIATLQTRTAAAEMRLADVERSTLAAVKAAKGEQSRLAAALDERTQAALRLAADLEAASAQRAKTADDLVAARLRLGEAEELLSRSETAREEALLENGRQLARIAERDAALRELTTDKRNLAARLSELVEKKGALAIPVATPSGGRAAGDQALRNAISRLGRDIARLNGKARSATPEPSNLVSFDRREATPHPTAAGEALLGGPAGKIRQGQPMSPER